MDKKTKMKEKKASGIWKKVLGICLAVIMVIGMTMPAWAQIDAESKGSIKVTADESGWTASAYRVIDVNFVLNNQRRKSLLMCGTKTPQNGSEQTLKIILKRTATA